MSRTEKWVSFVISALVFAGLFYFIYTSMKNPAPLAPVDQGDTAFEEDTFDFNEEAAEEPAKTAEPTAPVAADPAKKK